MVTMLDGDQHQVVPRSARRFVEARCAGNLTLTAALLALAACASLGPPSIRRDRTGYVTAVAESWKQQTLLNVVRMRYGDAPSFVDVTSVISSYTFEGQLAAGAQVEPQTSSTFGTIGGSAAYIDRPTITYTPLAGDRFTHSLLRPIPPSAIFELIQAGYPADIILLITARAVNGVYNRSSLGGETRDADPAFYPVLEALRRLQLSGDVTLRIQKHGSEEVGFLVLSGRRKAEADRDLDFVLKTLGVVPGPGGEIALTFGALPRSKSEIALLSRSMLGVLLQVASGVEVPSTHVAEGRTAPSSRLADAPVPQDRPFVRIRSGPKPPVGTYAAVHYRDTDYWIDDNDIASKRVFTFLMTFFSLAETGVVPQAPIVTVPAN